MYVNNSLYIYYTRLRDYYCPCFKDKETELREVICPRPSGWGKAEVEFKGT